MHENQIKPLTAHAKTTALNSKKNYKRSPRRALPVKNITKNTKGNIYLEYAKLDGKTILTHSEFSHPWYSFPPLYLDNAGSATTFLINPSGGILGGDNLTLFANLQEDTHVIFTTPSATKIYRTLKSPATQTIDVIVKPNAILEWMPDLTIPFAGSSFKQTINIQLHRGASLILWDAFAAGRIARGERWNFSHFENQIKVMLSDGRSLEEKYTLSPSQDKWCLTFEQGWNYVGSLYVISENVSSSNWSQIKEKLEHILGSNPSQILGGASETPIPGLGVKIMTRSSHDLNKALEKMLSIATIKLWGNAFPNLRCY